MAKFTIPFMEYQRGWYEIEADSMEQAKAIVDSGELIDFEPEYQDSRVEIDTNELTEVAEFPSVTLKY